MISIVAVLQVEFLPILGVDIDFSCSTVRGRRCLILLLIMHHTFSIGERVWTAGRPVKHTHSMPTKPCLL